MLIIKRKPDKEETNTRSFKVPNKVKESIDAVEYWLATWLAINKDHEGQINWDHEINKEILREIKRRNDKPERELSKVKITIPSETAVMMRECDKNYSAKGYSTEWESTIIKTLEKLLRKNTTVLSEALNEPPPASISDCYKPDATEPVYEPEKSEYQPDLDLVEEEEEEV